MPQIDDFMYFWPGYLPIFKITKIAYFWDYNDKYTTE